MSDKAPAASTRPPFTAISAKAYEHPADRAATAALHRLPFFDPLVKKLLELTIERRLMQLLLGNSVRLGEKQLPRVWEAHRDAYTALDITTVPTLHLIQNPRASALTLGAQRPTVLIQSGIVPMLDAQELRAVLAHEAGHVLSEHVRYRTTLELLLRFAVPRLPLSGRVPLQALISVLLAWYRAAELSCDRAAALVVGDPIVPCRALMKLAGGGPEGLSVDAFIQQADEYVKWDDIFDRQQRLPFELLSPHPFPVRRVYELTRWVKSGDYDRIMSGEYVRRGEEAPPSAELRSAVEHYTERFGELLDRTLGSLTDLTNRLTRWVESFNRD
ncbi:MAG TPA: M48 family metallopeptidase [Candidatus Binatia bacterium]|nr:M48 family metallopeptidase [Candidatus Binatia bacterium]